MTWAVFLDRDDTLIANRSLPPVVGVRPGDLADPSRVRLLDGALEGCRLLRRAGYSLVVVSNQGVVARGGATLEQVEATNDRLRSLLVAADGAPLLLDVLVCPYHPQGVVREYARDHPWRKPNPGMILHASEVHSLDLARSWVVGDSERDIEAGRRAGIPERHLILLDDSTPSVLAAALRILAHDAPRARSSASLRAAHPGLLNAERTRESVLSSGRALAERSGVRLLRLAIEDGRLDAEVDGPEIVALGFIAELRRITNRWHRARTGEALWSGL